MKPLDTKRLYSLARHLAFKCAIHECPEEVAKDLQQAGWVRYLTLKSDEHMWKDIEYAMLEEISRWNWQCKRGRGQNRRLKEKVPLFKLHAYTPGPEQILIAREDLLAAKQRRGIKSTLDRNPPAVDLF